MHEMLKWLVMGGSTIIEMEADVDIQILLFNENKKTKKIGECRPNLVQSKKRDNKTCNHFMCV